MKTIENGDAPREKGRRTGPLRAALAAGLALALLFGLCGLVTLKGEAEVQVKVRYDGQTYPGQDDPGYNTSKGGWSYGWDSYDMNGTMAVAQAPELAGAEYDEAGYGGSYTEGVSDAVDAGNAGTDAAPAHGKKLTYTYTYNAETEDFAGTLAALQDALDSTGGYFESSQVDARDYDTVDRLHRQSVRRGSYTIRVPEAHAAEIVAVLEGSGSVTYENVQMRDRTAAYVDAETQLRSHEAEYARLEELLGQASSVTELVEIQDRLSSLNYEIQWAKKQMELIDEDVAYATVNLTLYEVLYYTASVSRYRFEMGARFADAFEDFLYSVPDFLFAMVFLFIGGMVVTGVLSVLFRVMYNIRNKKSGGNVVHLVQDGAKPESGGDGA